jgi:heptosyltransferase-2
MQIYNILINQDCKHFLGYIPCKPSKIHNIQCSNCSFYEKSEGDLLIIKLGAIGDVIRTTTLIPKIRKAYPYYKIWWLTLSPEIVPEIVDKVLDYSVQSIEILKGIEFDMLINLDKDYEACSLAKNINAKFKRGFTIENNVPSPVDIMAGRKYITGLFDKFSKVNKKSYPEEIFEICGWMFEGEEYILDLDCSYKWNIANNGKKIIGLNTGCGARWVSRLWSDENWISLIKLLQNSGFYPMLLGGRQEHEKNQDYSENTGADYLGYFPLKQFISQVNQCDLVVSAVTMGMHIAIGLKKPLILMNNIFNPAEFELYGRGEIVQPDKECQCYFSQKCINKEYFCMEHLKPERIFEAIQRWVSFD